MYVYGNKYKVMSEDSELLREAALYVEETMKQYEKSGNVLTTSKLAIMAAIKIAVEYYEIKKEYNTCEQKLQEIVNKLS
ncbi:MAG: cell division protein ZapA [Calditerrivibrio sp.]|nr:cell division protein ZapA [Calditerrivibrio sp.]MCA1932611.1 cell division protein ZapA [Calditerrivibrio sp.]